MPDAEASRARVTVGVVIANDQVEMTVAVEVGLAYCAREPHLERLDQIARNEARGRENGRTDGGGGIGPLHEEYRRTAPVVDQDVCETVLVEIADSGAHWRHGGSVEDKRRRVQNECGEPFARAWRRGDDHLINPWVYIDEVVGQTVAVEVGEGNGCANERHPGSNMVEARMHVANDSVVRKA